MIEVRNNNLYHESEGQTVIVESIYGEEDNSSGSRYRYDRDEVECVRP